MSLLELRDRQYISSHLLATERKCALRTVENDVRQPFNWWKYLADCNASKRARSWFIPRTVIRRNYLELAANHLACWKVLALTIIILEECLQHMVHGQVSAYVCS
jgi:hypothetical protein